jgi:hypothetical protein
LKQQLEFRLVRVASSNHLAEQRTHSREIWRHERAENGAAKATNHCPYEKGDKKCHLAPLFVHDLALNRIDWPFNLAGSSALRHY